MVLAAKSFDETFIADLLERTDVLWASEFAMITQDERRGDAHAGD